MCFLPLTESSAFIDSLVHSFTALRGLCGPGIVPGLCELICFSRCHLNWFLMDEKKLVPGRGFQADRTTRAKPGA